VFIQIFVIMPIMETDRDDPQYLPKHWESAVAKIIADLENSTVSPSWTSTIGSNSKVTPAPIKVPIHLNSSQPAVNISALRTAADHILGVPAVNITAGAGHQRHSGKSAVNITADIGHSAVVPPASPPSVTVIPVLFPYMVEHPSGGAPSSATNKSVRIIMLVFTCVYLAVSPLCMYFLQEPNSTASVPVLPPISISIGNHSLHLNRTDSGTSSGPDVGAVVGWCFLSLLLLVAGLVLFSLLASMKLRVWVRHRLTRNR